MICSLTHGYIASSGMCRRRDRSRIPLHRVFIVNLDYNISGGGLGIRWTHILRGLDYAQAVLVKRCRWREGWRFASEKYFHRSPSIVRFGLKSALYLFLASFQLRGESARLGSDCRNFSCSGVYRGGIFRACGFLCGMVRC